MWRHENNSVVLKEISQILGQEDEKNLLKVLNEAKGLKIYTTTKNPSFCHRIQKVWSKLDQILSNLVHYAYRASQNWCQMFV